MVGIVLLGCWFRAQQRLLQNVFVVEQRVERRLHFPFLLLLQLPENGVFEVLVRRDAHRSVRILLGLSLWQVRRRHIVVVVRVNVVFRNGCRRKRFHLAVNDHRRLDVLHEPLFLWQQRMLTQPRMLSAQQWPMVLGILSGRQDDRFQFLLFMLYCRIHVVEVIDEIHLQQIFHIVRACRRFRCQRRDCVIDQRPIVSPSRPWPILRRNTLLVVR